MSTTQSYALFETAEGPSSGWKESPWFGWVFTEGYGKGWVFHDQLGWMFVTGSNDSSIWMYSAEMGWQWTGSNTFPYFYNNDTKSWRFTDLFSADGKLWYYDFTSDDWYNEDLIRGYAPTSIIGANPFFVGLTGLELGGTRVIAHEFLKDGTFYIDFSSSVDGESFTGRFNGTYKYKKSTTEANKATFSFTFTSLFMSGDGFSVSGTYQELADGGRLPETFDLTLEFAGEGYGSYTGIITHTDGWRISDVGLF